MVLSSEVVALLVTLGLSLVPSVLFLGLWRGLLRLRDDRLVDDVLARVETGRGPAGVVGPGGDANPFLSDETDGVTARDHGPVGCQSCGVLRAPGETCPACGTEPGEE